MNNQRDIWETEHTTPQTFVRLHSNIPSAPVHSFMDFLEQRFIPSDTHILDIGTGKGRNAIYVASRGFQSTGIDFSSAAIEEAKKRANTKGISRINFKVVDLGKQWPFDDQSFHAIIDCNTTICIPNPSRAYAIREAERVLKPGGYYLFYGIGQTDFVYNSPGAEPNSTIFPRTGKFEKQYTKEELIKSYEMLTLENLDEIEGRDKIEGKEIIYSMWVARFKKN